LESNREKAETLSLNNIIEDNKLSNQQSTTFHYSNTPKKFALLTMHRPSNVDTKEILQPLIEFLSNEVTKDMHLIWPIHPRTQNRLKKFGLWEDVVKNEQIVLLYPVGYHEMLKLNMEAKVILTDSGGLQEESCVLGTPCLTLRWNTERPITLRENGGASVLVGNNVDRIRKEYKETLQLNISPQIPELWDGQTAERCVSAMLNYKEN